MTFLVPAHMTACPSCMFHCFLHSSRQIRTYPMPLKGPKRDFIVPRSRLATMPVMEVYAAGSIRDLCRPCVDCGKFTGRYCDGLAFDCFAKDHVPSERWCEGQRTPLCSTCEWTSEVCHYCRGVHYCQPFPKGSPPEDPNPQDN